MKQRVYTIGGYKLTSSRKVRDIIDKSKDEKMILALYDKRAGAIWKDGKKLETGTFWDFANNRPFHVEETKEEPKEAVKKQSKKNEGKS